MTNMPAQACTLGTPSLLPQPQSPRRTADGGWGTRPRGVLPQRWPGTGSQVVWAFSPAPIKTLAPQDREPSALSSPQGLGDPLQEPLSLRAHTQGHRSGTLSPSLVTEQVHRPWSAWSTGLPGAGKLNGSSPLFPLALPLAALRVGLLLLGCRSLVKVTPLLPRALLCGTGLCRPL